MAYPPYPTISFDYSAFEQGLGDASFPGIPLDNDLGSVAASLTSTIQFLQLSFRADGVLKNTSAPDSAAPPGVPIIVEGSRSAGTALTNLLTALELVGIITDNTVT